MRPYTHMLAEGGIATLQYAVEWKREASGKRFNPDPTRPDTGVHTPGLERRLAKMVPSFCRAHGLFPIQISQSQMDIKLRRGQVRFGRCQREKRWGWGGGARGAFQRCMESATTYGDVKKPDSRPS